MSSCVDITRLSAAATLLTKRSKAVKGDIPRKSSTRQRACWDPQKPWRVFGGDFPLVAGRSSEASLALKGGGA